MNNRSVRLTVFLSAASLLVGSVFTYGGEFKPAEVTLKDDVPIPTTSDETYQDYYWTGIPTDENEESYDTDFDGLSGNYLLAINPDPWLTYVDEKDPEDDKKGKHIGFEQGMKEAYEKGLLKGIKDTKGIKETGRFNVPYVKYRTNELIDDFPAKLTPRTSVRGEDVPEYKKGDVMVRLVMVNVAGEPGEDFITTNEFATSRIYQCLYAGEVATLWGSVSMDRLSDKEKEASVKLDEALKIYDGADDVEIDPDLSGIIGTSEDIYRTCVSKDSIDKIDEIGREFDKYIKKQKEYTGDYLEVDRKYGDGDKKAAFLLEPVDPKNPDGITYGFAAYIDLDYPAAGNALMDGLHLNEVNLSHENYDHLFATMLHEMQHLILYGYLDDLESNPADLWINEWLAQTISMQVFGSRNDEVEMFCKSISNYSSRYSLIYPYAFGNDISADPNAYYNNYKVAYVLGEYFIEHVNDRFIKDLTLLAKDQTLNSDSVSVYLKEKTGHTLPWWISSFTIAFLSGVDGTDPEVEKGSVYDAGTFYAILDSQQYLREVHKKYGIINDTAALSENLVIPGGGAVMAFRSDTDRTWNIKDIGKGVVWALRDSNGNIVSVKGLEYLDEIKKDEPENKKQTEPVRNPDGSWDYSDDQEESLSLLLRPENAVSIPGTDASLIMSLTMRNTLSYNPDRKALEKAILDMEKSKVSVNGTDIGIKKVTLKNPKNAYISENSIFKNTVSENNRTAYAAFKDKKKPGFYLTLETKGLSGDLKKAVKKANKQMKKNPFPIEILPVDLTSSNLTIDKYNEAKKVIKKATVKIDENTSSKIKYNSSGKKDFTSEKEGDLIILTGTNNYNGQVSFDPATKILKPV